jgi:hypothetical protein
MTIEMQPVPPQQPEQPATPVLPVAPVPSVLGCGAVGFVATGLVTYLVLFHTHLQGDRPWEVFFAGLVVPAALVAAALPNRRFLAGLFTFGGSVIGLSVVFAAALVHLLSNIGGPFTFSDG